MKQILLTGGAGGLGQAVAAFLAERDCRVFSCDLKKTPEHPNIVPIIMDLRDADSIESARVQVSAMTGRLDAVISLAGLYMMDSFIEISEERLSTIMDVNLMGVYRVNKAFMPLIIAGGGRIIITTSELAGQKPLPFTGIYALSKTALECYADSLRLELALLGIPVISVRPGAFRTHMTDVPAQELERFCASTKFYSGRLQNIKSLMDSQIGKAKEPAELAKVIWRAVSAAHPRIRYSKNANGLLKLYSAMPRRLQMFAMKRLLMKKDPQKNTAF